MISLPPSLLDSAKKIYKKKKRKALSSVKKRKEKKRKKRTGYGISNTYRSQFVDMEIGMPIWTPHLSGRALAASSLMFWNLLAAAFTHRQASRLSVVEGVKAFKFWTPLQHGVGGLPPPVRYGMQGASEVSTCPHVTA